MAVGVRPIAVEGPWLVLTAHGGVAPPHRCFSIDSSERLALNRQPFAIFPSTSRVRTLELFVSRRPSGLQLASTQSKAWELVRQAAQGGASPEACRLGVLMLCWQQPLHESMWPGDGQPLAPGVWLWDRRWLGLFLVHLPALPKEPGYSGLRLLHARSAERLQALGQDGTLEETVKVAAMGALKELARDLGDEQLVRLSTEELLRRGRLEGRREGIRIGEQRGIRIGEQRGREALLALAEQLLGPDAARTLAEEQDLEALRRRLTELLQRR